MQHTSLPYMLIMFWGNIRVHCLWAHCMGHTWGGRSCISWHMSCWKSHRWALSIWWDTMDGCIMGRGCLCVTLNCVETVLRKRSRWNGFNVVPKGSAKIMFPVFKGTRLREGVFWQAMHIRAALFWWPSWIWWKDRLFNDYKQQYKKFEFRISAQRRLHLVFVVENYALILNLVVTRVTC